MKAGTWVELPDGRQGTVVYNGLDGRGIKWGLHDVTLEDIGGSGGMFDEVPGDDFEWHPDALLRAPYAAAGLPCVGSEFRILERKKVDV